MMKQTDMQKKGRQTGEREERERSTEWATSGMKEGGRRKEKKKHYRSKHPVALSMNDKAQSRAQQGSKGSSEKKRTFMQTDETFSVEQTLLDTRKRLREVPAYGKNEGRCMNCME